MGAVSLKAELFEQGGEVALQVENIDVAPKNNCHMTLERGDKKTVTLRRQQQWSMEFFHSDRCFLPLILPVNHST